MSSAAHLLTENQHGLVMMSRVTQADGYAERETSKEMLGKIAPRKRRLTGTTIPSALPKPCGR
ncbi:hypothetical protein GURASL_05450 [Geotalea uraniireducens]|uniref:Uncharacterized protein n=1 Tax=Geotalea uraniireducens TaxID=351604 RepID=A0ABN6VTX1_9BACT|nr:hypothetical protein GURASL_05450 [Geotalea uraniireducens]